jgi:hypothetical protein
MSTIHKTKINQYIECESGTYFPQPEELTSERDTIVENPFFFLPICLEGMLERMLLKRP